MYGLMAAVGTAASKLGEKRLGEIWPVRSQFEVLSPRPDIRIARFAPPDSAEGCGFAWSKDRQVVVYIDGYLYTSNASRNASRSEQAAAFADACRRDGYEAAIRSITGGTFNLAVVDLSGSCIHLTTDHAGTLPLYHSPVEGGWLLSTNPVALARSGIINLEPDLTAMAQMAYIGYTIGDRFLIKGIRVVPPFTSFHWDSGSKKGRLKENDDSPWNIVPEGDGPSADMLVDALVESCRRIEIFDPRPAHMQSSGKDSRIILASWPEGYDPPCYTYGDIDSHEVGIARSVAEQRGSSWTHVWLDGDGVAPDLDGIFSRVGMIVFPDRLLAARRIWSDGFSGVLDGYLGGVTQGGSYLGGDRYFGLLPKLARYLTKFVDQKVSGIGKDRIADALFDSVLEIREDRVFHEYLRKDFVALLRAEWPNMLEDIRCEVDRCVPANDSLGGLWNRFILGTRGLHAICQQMAIVRSHIDVYCPFSGDVEYHRMQWRIPPHRSSYRRIYIEMYRRRFPEFGRIPYGASLIPLTRSATSHQWSKYLMSRGVSIPGVTGNPKGRERDANSWGKWLHQSASMRDTALGFLREGGILDEESGTRTLDAVRLGAKKEGGKLFHFAGISKWMALKKNG